MKNIQHFMIDALIATLESARAAWAETGARRTAQRVARYAERFVAGRPAATGPDDTESIDDLLSALRAETTTESTKTTILLVEDDRLTAHIVTDILTAPRRTVVVAQTAAHASVLLREHEIDLILLDLLLPDGDGRDLLVHIRSTPSSATVPVLVMTAHTDPITHAECFALGADAVLHKPADPHLLVAAISAHLAHAAERRREGRIDGLTMLPNRTAFLDALERAVPLARRNQQPIAVGMIDLDHFKSVNDTYGHAVGDDVLRDVARAITDALRTSDMVARWGGEEICVLFPDTVGIGAVRALNKALSAVRLLEFGPQGQRFGVTFSAGLTTDVAAPREMLEEADRLLYVAKSCGRNRVMSALDEADPPRPRALLVEDDAAVADVVTRILDRAGYEVTYFPDGGGVLEAARSQHFTIAIIDVHLPVMSGFDVVTGIRAMPSAAKLPVLFLTGSDDESDVVHGFEVGANDYLVKPFHAGELIARISRLLPKR